MDSSEQTPISPNPEISSPQVVSVIIWVLAASFVTATATRLGTKLSMRRVLSIDDFLIVGAAMLGVGQTIATFIMTRIGWSDVMDPASDAFQKAFYAAELLYLPTIFLAKLSALYSLQKISPVRQHTQLILCLMGAICLILVTFEIAAANQCSGLHWKVLSGKCFKQSLFWSFFGAFDITTDAFIIGVPLYVVWNVKIASKVKLIFVGSFGSRICTIAASICRLVYLSRAERTIYNFWILVLCTEISQGLAMITTCIPFLKPFFESLETGMLATSNNTVLATGASSNSKGSRSALGLSVPTVTSMERMNRRGTASTDSQSDRELLNHPARSALHVQSN